MSFSKIFENGSSIEIGLYFSILYLSPFLKSGIVLAHFNDSGKTPSLKHILKIFDKISTIFKEIF